MTAHHLSRCTSAAGGATHRLIVYTITVILYCRRVQISYAYIILYYGLLCIRRAHDKKRFSAVVYDYVLHHHASLIQHIRACARASAFGNA